MDAILVIESCVVALVCLLLWKKAYLYDTNGEPTSGDRVVFCLLSITVIPMLSLAVAILSRSVAFPITLVLLPALIFLWWYSKAPVK